MAKGSATFLGAQFHGCRGSALEGLPQAPASRGPVPAQRLVEGPVRTLWGAATPALCGAPGKEPCFRESAASSPVPQGFRLSHLDVGVAGLRQAVESGLPCPCCRVLLGPMAGRKVTGARGVQGATQGVHPAGLGRRPPPCVGAGGRPPNGLRPSLTAASLTRLLSWVSLSPPVCMWKVLAPEPVGVTLFGNGCLQTIELRRGHKRVSCCT